MAVLLSFLLIGSVVRLGAATQPKFRSSGSADSGFGRYLVTLAAEADAGDLAATKGELAALYGARLDPDAPAGIRQFTVTATAARARLLSSDPRVSEVTEAPATSPAPSAPTPARHFAPQTTGYGDNGQSGTYTYDSSGNITAIGTDTYLYDLQGRLKAAVTRGVEEDYTYDAFGNRKTASGATNCLGQTTCAQPGAVDAPTNRLQTINGNTVQYDAAGSITDIAGTPSTHYVYDGTAMMTQATVGSDDRQFIYTADDERIAVKRGASWTWSVRDLNQKVMREFTSAETGGASFAMTSRAWLKDYVWRDGLLLATTAPNGTLHYHLDHLGTPRLITDINRVKVAEHAYYPFGAELSIAPHENPEEAMKFTGHERDLVAGDGHTLDYMHARYYNGGIGRFVSADDSRGAIAHPQTWNKYAYAFNNPMGLVDKNGRWPEATHNRLVDLAFPGLSSFDRSVLKRASSNTDEWAFGGQARSNSFKHGMRAPWQSVAEAQRLAAQFYSTTINEAAAARSNGEKSSYFDALYGLGVALHLVTDLTSPTHRGFQVWDFNPRSVGAHMAGESRPPTNDEIAIAISMMRAAYAEVFGQDAADAAAGQPAASATAPAPPKVPQLTITGSSDRCFDVSCH